MPILSPSIVSLLLVLLISLPNFNDASVPDACNAAAASSPNVDPNFCATSLQADPNSASADSIGLAKIATSIALENAKTTKAKIKTLFAEAAHNNNDINPQLHTCKSLYSSMIDNLSVAADAIDFATDSNHGTAKTYLSAALDRPGNCEEAFSEKQITSVLSAENDTAKQLAAIALAVINMC